MIPSRMRQNYEQNWWQTKREKKANRCLQETWCYTLCLWSLLSFTSILLFLSFFLYLGNLHFIKQHKSTSSTSKLHHITVIVILFFLLVLLVLAGTALVKPLSRLRRSLLSLFHLQQILFPSANCWLAQYSSDWSSLRASSDCCWLISACRRALTRSRSSWDIALPCGLALPPIVGGTRKRTNKTFNI